MVKSVVIEGYVSGVSSLSDVEIHLRHIVDGIAHKCGCEYQTLPFWRWVWNNLS